MEMWHLGMTWGEFALLCTAAATASGFLWVGCAIACAGAQVRVALDRAYPEGHFVQAAMDAAADAPAYTDCPHEDACIVRCDGCCRLDAPHTCQA